MILGLRSFLITLITSIINITTVSGVVTATIIIIITRRRDHSDQHQLQHPCLSQCNDKRHPAPLQRHLLRFHRQNRPEHNHNLRRQRDRHQLVVDLIFTSAYHHRQHSASSASLPHDTIDQHLKQQTHDRQCHRFCLFH